MINASEFSEIFTGCDIVSLGCLSCAREIPEKDMRSVYNNLRQPSPLSLAKADSFVSRLIARMKFLVGPILGTRAYPKIYSSIVQSVSVFMIPVLGSFKYLLVHCQCVISVSSARIKSMNFSLPVSIPIPLIEPVVIVGIHGRHLPFGERNKFDRLIERLNNKIALDAILGHDLTPNEIAVFDRIPVLAQGRM